MWHMRRIAISIFGVVGLTALALSTAPSAFATRVLPVSGGDSGQVVISSPQHAGLSAGQISVLVVAGTLLLVALFACVVVRSRRSHRAQSGQFCLDPDADRVRSVHRAEDLVQEAAKGVRTE
jgi:hypothetical protein